jgi:peptide/nickel transport system permease protein
MVLVVLAVFPQSLVAAMVTFGVLSSPGMIRVIRSATLPVRDELYIDAARVAGLRTGSILAKHILPRIAGAVIVQASLVCGIALLVQTGLAFLQLVVPAPAPSWGGMIAEALGVLETDPWMSLPSGAIVALTVLVFALLGDAIRDSATEGWSAAMRVSRPSRRAVTAMPASPQTDTPTLDETDVAGGADHALLSVEHLTVAVRGGTVLLDDVTFSVRKAETVAIVGESGSGKSMTARAIMGLLPASIEVVGGAIRFDHTDLLTLGEPQRRRFRGGSVAMISQEPAATLDPAFRVGQQISEVVKRHQRLSSRASWARAVELLDQVELPHPGAIARAYPHELSGGMAQRVSIARALAGDPDLLIADEPTSALDVTLQASILDLLRRLQQTTHMALLLITHDWGVVADIADRVLVMYAGQLVESGSSHEIFYSPIHPYTAALLASDIHRVDDAEALPSIPGVVPRAGEWPVGCRFHPRCQYSTDACVTLPIPLEHVGARSTRCIRSHELQVRNER